MNRSPELPPLRCATAGSVDDGKSTLLGRILFDAKALMTDQLSHVEDASRRRGYARTDLALLTDGLRAEREQGITIDVAWRYFATPRRRFVLADAPGHVQYTRNMVTATSQADVVIVLVDARRGVLDQTRRHLFVARLLGVPTLAIALNKMDQVGFDHDVYQTLRNDVTSYLAGLDLPGKSPELTFFPVSALLGDNVVDSSASTPWYDGPPLLTFLEGLPGALDRAALPTRFAVQWVIRPQSEAYPDYRGYAGRVLSGVLRRGDRINAWPSGVASSVTRIESYGRDLDEARAGRSVVVHLDDNIDVTRGDLLAKSIEPPPRLTQTLEADVAWLHTSRARAGVPYALKQASREVRVRIDAVEYAYDITTGARASASDGLTINDIGHVRLTTAEPVAIDSYAELAANGAFVLIDPASGATLAAGVTRD